MEQRVSLPVEEGFDLEGGYTSGNGAGGAVLTHPHPLYGGSMDNNVVLALRAACEELGLGALRFNFRGVGRSGGEHGGGKPEVADLRGAVTYARAQAPEGAPCHVIGYSFGAAVAVRACMAGMEPAALTLISPPVDFMNFNHLRLAPCPVLVVVGTMDDFCSEASLRQWLARNEHDDVLVEILAHADHFYVGCEHKVRRLLKGFLAERG